MGNSWWQAFRALLGSKARKLTGCSTKRLAVEGLEDRRLMATRVWSGGSTRSDAWTLAANWVGNIAPVAGDDLVFQAGVAMAARSTTNNFTVDTLFHSIRIEDLGYTLAGNRVKLSGNLTYAPPLLSLSSDEPRVNLDLRFTAGAHLILSDGEKGPNVRWQINGRISDDAGDGQLLIESSHDAAAELHVGGTGANTYHNLVTVQTISGSMFLRLDKPDNVAAIAGPLTVAGANSSIAACPTAGGIEHFGQLKPGIPVIVRDSTVNTGGAFFGRESIGNLTLDNASIKVETVDRGANPPLTGQLTVTGGIVVNRGVSRIVGDAGATFDMADASGETRIGVADSSSLVISRRVTGGDLRKAGEGLLQIEAREAANGYGLTRIDEGTLRVNRASTFVAIPHDVIIGGAAEAGGAELLLSGSRDVIDDTATVTVRHGGAFHVSERAGENLHALSIEDTSAVTPAGTALIDLRSALTVLDALSIDANASFRAIDGSFASIAGLSDRGTFIVTNSKVFVRSIAQFLGAAALGENDDSTLDFQGQLVLEGSKISTTGVGRTLIRAGITSQAAPVAAQINGSMQLTPGTHPLLVEDGNATNDLLISSVVSDTTAIFANDSPGSLAKSGPGRVVLNGSNTYTGSTSISGPALVNGQNGINQGTYEVNGGGFLAGRGAVHSLAVSPAGVVNPGNGVGILTVQDETTFAPQSKFVVNINGTTAGSQFDQLRTGSLELEFAPAFGHPILDPRLGFTPSVGNRFRILDIAGTTPLPTDQIFQRPSGLQLTEGKTFQINGLDFTITYLGNNGNDVVLVRNTAPAFQDRTITPVITEGDKAFITGHITEPDPNNVFFLDVDWGDGTPEQTFRFNPGTPRDIQVGHRYLDDPAGPDDHYQVHLTWRDQFGGANSGVLTTVVHNAAPFIQDITASLPPLRVGEPLTIQGAFVDRSPKDSFKVHVQWDANGPWQSINLPAGSTSFRARHTYNKAGQHRVTLLVVDDDLDVDSEQLVLTVR